MKWKKRGRIFEPLGQYDWMKKYGILPTPFYLEEKNSIRIYFATSSMDNIGKITYMEVDADNPAKVLKSPDEQILSEGVNGTFDDCGVNPSSVLTHNNKTFLY